MLKHVAVCLALQRASTGGVSERQVVRTNVNTHQLLTTETAELGANFLTLK